LALSYLKESSGGNAERIDASKINSALLVLEEAKKIEPGNPRIYSAEGYIYMVSSQNDKAISAFTKSLELDDNNSEALVKRATAYNSMGKTNEAISDLEKAATLDKDKVNMEIYMSLCGLYVNNSDKQKATENCNIIINGNGSQILKDEANKILESIK
jgi:Flp pilus assembly protein TadD